MSTLPGGGNSFNPNGLDKQEPGPFPASTGREAYGTPTPMQWLRNKTKGAMGPVDPLTGQEESTHRDIVTSSMTIDDKFLTLIDMFHEFMNELKAEHPVVRLQVVGGQGSDALAMHAGNDQSREFYFILSGKKVTAQKFFIQNNSAQTIYFNFGEPATPGKGTLLTGQFANLEVEVDSVNLLTAVSNLNVNGNAAGHIFIAAWGSENQMYQKGAA